MNKIIITGIAGLVGSNLAHWILENTEDEIVGIDNLQGGVMDNVPELSNRCHFYKLNIEDDELNDVFEKHKPTHCFHAAAVAWECLSPFMRKKTYINNIVATSGIVNNSIIYNSKLCFLSSMATYGDGNGTLPPFPETLTPCPVDSYGIAKYACEMDIKVAGEQHGLEWVIIKPHNIFGKRQVYFDRYRNVLGIWMYKYLQNQTLTIFGDGLQKRAFSYIDDSIPCFYKALIQENCSNQIINLGGIKEYTILEAAKTLVEVINEDGNPYGIPEIIHLEPRHEVKYAYPTYQKSVDLLGFEHKTDLKEGLTHMWKWVKEDYSKYKRKQLTFDKYEIEKGIYSFWKNK
jgi:UDP-glucose 4-epimerase